MLKRTLKQNFTISFVEKTINFVKHALYKGARALFPFV